MKPDSLGSWAALLRDVPDFPRPGILFKDILPLLAHGEGFAAAVDAMAAPWRGAGVTAIAGVEARGFILGAAMAREMGIGFVPIRKPGKLPGAVHEISYELEYGSDRLQAQADALGDGDRVLLVDDVLATGGTLVAAAGLLAQLPCTLMGASVLIELQGLAGRERWGQRPKLCATLVY